MHAIVVLLSCATLFFGETSRGFSECYDHRIFPGFVGMKNEMTVNVTRAVLFSSHNFLHLAFLLIHIIVFATMSSGSVTEENLYLIDQGLSTFCLMIDSFARAFVAFLIAANSRLCCQMTGRLQLFRPLQVLKRETGYHRMLPMFPWQPPMQLLQHILKCQHGLVLVPSVVLE